jgi:hypothetical protein
MTREEAIAELKQLEQGSWGDTEAAHLRADEILCDLLTNAGYGDVVAEWEKVQKWYK